MTDEEKKELLEIIEKQARDIKTIKNILLFFFIISLFGTVGYIFLSIGGIFR